jgi:hypothetical protein
MVCFFMTEYFFRSNEFYCLRLFHFSTGWPQVLFDQPTLLFHTDLLIVQPGEETAPEAARLASETTRRFTPASAIPLSDPAISRAGRLCR